MLALGAVLALVLGVRPAPAQAASFTGTLAQAIAQIPTAGESNTGYDRNLFPHWVDANGDCQNARQEVLISEADATVMYTTSGKCTVASGRWYSYYDRVSWTNPGDVDIDHMVPLAEAWGSGARSWTTARRQAYANDLGDHRTLVGVTDNVNQAKGDKDPNDWMPTYDRCRYVAEWVAVKIRWGLSADSAEKSALSGYAAGCSNTVTVSTA
ncbi:hypothetical protein ASE01_19520 [Nocardioides sp. Root190]|nr:hypothetical protein ASE01_19520 [Nocardioides sp. Root190]